MPVALIEALATHTPVVSTDCPSGPREVLDGGRYGALVPVGDDLAMAEAILRTLRAETPRPDFDAAVSDYRDDRSAAAYLEALGLARGRA
jgi:glycosyltransferase involved in cell wall biosynthesis